MLRNKKFVYVCFTIVVLGLITTALYNRAKPLQKDASAALPATTTILDFNAVELTNAGQLQRQLSTPQLVHHAASSKKKLQNPIIHLTRNKQPWTITADHAISNHDDSKIILKGHVHIKQYKNNLKISELQTSRLNYYPKTQKVETDQAITYLSQGMTIHSKGLRADLHEETMELVSNARGTYVPNKKPKRS